MCSTCTYQEIPIRNSIRILLINDHQELLLMGANDPKITSKHGSYQGRFWFPIGGEIEKGESLMEAAVRELKEETGLDQEAVKFGPVVWFGEFEMILSGKLTRLKQQFLVAHTNQKSTTLENLTAEEKQNIEKLQWFSLEAICQSKEVIFPVVLKDHLPDILEGKYPNKPMWIDLAKQPTAKR